MVVTFIYPNNVRRKQGRKTKEQQLHITYDWKWRRMSLLWLSYPPETVRHIAKLWWIPNALNDLPAFFGLHVMASYGGYLTLTTHLIELGLLLKYTLEAQKSHSPDMLIRATNFPNSREIPLSCSWNLAWKNFLGCCCCCCCCCCLLLLRLPLLGSLILLGSSPFPVWCGPPITMPLEQWPLLTPGLLPDLKSLCNDKKRTHIQLVRWLQLLL